MRAEQARPGRNDDRVWGASAGAEVPERFGSLVEQALPGAAVEIDRPLHDDGEWWFDVRHGDFETSVSWSPRRGFGIYLEAPGYGERPHELYAEPHLATLRLRQMAAASTHGGSGGSLPMGIGQVRRLLGRTQMDLAATLSVGQANVSRLEGRANLTLGSLRALIEAMGGELEVRARFPSLDVPLALPSPEHET